MSILNKLKERRKNLDELAAKMKQDATGKTEFKQDDRFYYPQLDEKGNGYAVLRFIPPQWEDEPNYVRLYKHEFQGVGGWMIEGCPTTLGKNQTCPVCEANSDAWNSGDKENARRRKRKLYFIANVYVVKDPKNPENEGKLFLFRFGKKIMDKLVQALEPEFPDDPVFDPFDLWDGANFKLKIRKVDNQTNYDLSEFDDVGELADDSELEKIIEQTHKLSEFIDPAQFKSYEELKERFEIVEGLRRNNAASAVAESEPEKEPSKSVDEKVEQAMDVEDEIPFDIDDDDDLFD